MKRGQIYLSFIAVCLLGCAVYLSLVWISPPRKPTLGSPGSYFSAIRAMKDLEIIAREPHPMGEFAAHASVRDYLMGEIRVLGLEPELQDTFGFRYIPDQNFLGGRVENILARLPGSDPNDAILLMAHYDSTPGAPGAADNGSGVVTILEILRVLTNHPRLKHDVIFFFTDGEEPGVIGADAFIKLHPWVDEVKIAINLDTITDRPLTLIRTNGENGFWIQALAQSTTRPAFVSLPYEYFPVGDTDLLPFNEAGIPAADFLATGEFLEIHTMLDEVNLVDPTRVQQVGHQLLSLIIHLGDQSDLVAEGSDQTFFPMFGRLVHYPSSWALPLAVIAGILCFIACFLGFHRKVLTWKGVFLGALSFLLFLILSIGMVLLLWQGIQWLHPGYQYSGIRPYLDGDYLYTIGFVMLMFALTTSTISVFRKRVTSLDLNAGSLFIWFLITIASTIIVPASSYLSTWVLLVGSLGLLLAIRVKNLPIESCLTAVVFLTNAILVTFLYLPVLYIAFRNPGFPMVWMGIALSSLWLGGMVAILDQVLQSSSWVLPAIACVSGFCLLFVGHFYVGRNSPPRHVNSIGYWLDAESGSASWIAFIGGLRTDARTNARFEVEFPDEMDERQQHLLSRPIRQPYTALFPGTPPFSVLSSEAPLLLLEGPHLELIADELVGKIRVMEIHFSTSMKDRLYIVLPEIYLQAITFPNNKRIPVDANYEWWIRLDGMPSEGIDIQFEFDSSKATQFFLIEEKTGLPTFPGLVTQPVPGTMKSPGEFLQGVAGDFTVVYRYIEISP